MFSFSLLLDPAVRPFFTVFAFLLGAIIGSFLNVLIYRMHTGRSLSGRSHCMTCGTTLTWKELVPLLSYVIQAGRCVSCRAHIPSRYFVIELATGVVFASLLWFAGSDVLYFALLSTLASILIVLFLYDIRHLIIPDELTLSVLFISILMVVYRYGETNDPQIFMESLIGGSVAFLFFWALWKLTRGKGIGFGDAKLAFPLGLLVGLLPALSMIVLSFWIGAGVSLMLMLLGRFLKQGKTSLRFLRTPLTMKSEVPFAPFLILSFCATYFFHANILSIIERLF